MRVERIEALLRSTPPDEPIYRRELILGPRTVTPSGQPVHGRWPVAGLLATAAGAVAVLAMVGTVVGPLTALPSSAPPASRLATSALEASPPLAAVPWLDATPPPPATPEPTADPRMLPICTSRDLILTASGWGGATGSMAGGASVINLGSNPCTVSGKPGIELLDSHGTVIARGVAAEPSPTSPLVVLATGGVAGVTVVWSNWCVGPPPRPLHIRLSIPEGGGDLTTAVRDAPGVPGEVPRCDSPGSGSTFAVPLDFVAP